MRCKKRYISSSKGQAAVETALVLPIILMIFFIIIEFGRIFNAYMIINNASREGAREAALGRTYSQVETRIDNISSTLGTVGINIDKLTDSVDNREQGESVTVTVSHDLTLITPIIGPLISGSEDSNTINISSTTSMRVE